MTVSSTVDRHLILDWNGTLIDDLDAAVAGVNLVLAGQNLAPIDRDIYRNNFGFPIQEFYARIGVDFSKITFPDLGRLYLSHFNTAIKSCTIFDGTFELFERARQEGYRISVLSASQKDTLSSNLEDAGLITLIDYIFGLEDENARGKHALAERLDATLGRPGEKAVMIGDTDHDVEIAKYFGWRMKSVAHGHQSRRRLEKLHSAVFDDLHTIIETEFLTLEQKELTNAQ